MGVRRRDPGAGPPAGPAVVAEGVEDEGQLDRLRGMGCELGQGFYFARPIAAGPAVHARGSRPSLAMAAPSLAVAASENAAISTD